MTTAAALETLTPPAAPGTAGTPGTPATPASMAAYYGQRAAGYERVYGKPERQQDLRAMEAWLATRFVDRKVLEIACGTGWWTPHGAAPAAHWRATDLSPATLAVAQAKAAMPATVRFQTVDAYTLAELGDETFDAAFAGCWWSHVPLDCLQPWLDTLHARLRPGAVVVVLDNRLVPASSTPISRTDLQGNTYQQRRLDDGSAHEVLKNFPAAAQAIAALGPRALDPHWTAWAHYWALTWTVA